MALDLRTSYATHAAFVCRNLHRLGVPEARLEDAMQEVFLVLHRRASRFDSARSSDKTWIFGVVLHVAANERRAARRQRARISNVSEPEFWEQLPSLAAGPVELLAQREHGRKLQLAFETLTERGRTIVQLVDVEAMSVPEAAQLLGVNLNTAYGRLREARAQLKRVLARMR